jgi:hypothetical protein
MMLSQFSAKLVAASFALILGVVVFYAWRADHHDRAQLAAELAATKQLLTAADSRQRDRDAHLAQTLSALEAQKRSIVTPDQIVRQLQKNISLPAPIALQSPQDTDARRGRIYQTVTKRAAKNKPKRCFETPEHRFFLFGEVFSGG